MTTVQDFTTAVKAVATQTTTVLSRPPPVPVALNTAIVTSTSVFPTQQPAYREVAQRRRKTLSEHTKPPTLQPPAMYKKGAVRSQVPKAIHTDLRRCEVPVRHLSTHMPEKLRQLKIVTLWPAAKPLATWSIEPRREAHFTAASSFPNLKLSFGANTSTSLASITRKGRQSQREA